MFLVFGFPPLRQNIMTTSPNIAKPIFSHTFTNGIRTRRFLNALEKMIGWVEYASDLTNPLLWPEVTMNSSHLNQESLKHNRRHRLSSEKVQLLLYRCPITLFCRVT